MFSLGYFLVSKSIGEGFDERVSEFFAFEFET